MQVGAAMDALSRGFVGDTFASCCYAGACPPFVRAPPPFRALAARIFGVVVFEESAAVSWSFIGCAIVQSSQEHGGILQLLIILSEKVSALFWVFDTNSGADSETPEEIFMGYFV